MESHAMELFLASNGDRFVMESFNVRKKTNIDVAMECVFPENSPLMELIIVSIPVMNKNYRVLFVCLTRVRLKVSTDVTNVFVEKMNSLVVMVNVFLGPVWSIERMDAEVIDIRLTDVTQRATITVDETMQESVERPSSPFNRWRRHSVVSLAFVIS